MYEEIFKTFDTIPTVTFLIYFTILYLLSIFLLHCLLWSCSQSYQSLGYGRQSYVLCKLLEVNIFIFICYMGINALLREDVNLFDTTNHKQNPQMMVKMSKCVGLPTRHLCPPRRLQRRGNIQGEDIFDIFIYF